METSSVLQYYDKWNFTKLPFPQKYRKYFLARWSIFRALKTFQPLPEVWHEDQESISRDPFDKRGSCVKRSGGSETNSIESKFICKLVENISKYILEL